MATRLLKCMAATLQALKLYEKNNLRNELSSACHNYHYSSLKCDKSPNCSRGCLMKSILHFTWTYCKGFLQREMTGTPILPWTVILVIFRIYLMQMFFSATAPAPNEQTWNANITVNCPMHKTQYTNVSTLNKTKKPSASHRSTMYRVRRQACTGVSYSKTTQEALQQSCTQAKPLLPSYW